LQRQVERKALPVLRNTESAEVIRTFVGHSDRSMRSPCPPTASGWRRAYRQKRHYLGYETGELIRKLDGHKGEVYAVAFSR